MDWLATRLCQPNSVGKSTVWPRLEIGKSSVTPCRSPSTIAWKVEIGCAAAAAMCVESTLVTRAIIADGPPPRAPAIVFVATATPSEESEMSVDGTWKITLQTPLGAQESTVALACDGGALTGTQSGNGEEGPIYDGSCDGDTATWKVDISRPMSLTVTFKATVSGDSISGTASAGFFPTSKFTGARA